MSDVVVDLSCGKFTNPNPWRGLSKSHLQYDTRYNVDFLIKYV